MSQLAARLSNRINVRTVHSSLATPVGKAGVVLFALAQSDWQAPVGVRPALQFPADPLPWAVRVYRLAITQAGQAGALPGLNQVDGAGNPRPSLLRDAAALAVQGSSGPVEVVVLLTRELDAGGNPGRSLAPWEFDPGSFRQAEEYRQALETVLRTWTGGVLVFPDVGGPAELAPGLQAASLEERRARMVQSLLYLSRDITARYQVILADAVAGHRHALESDQWLEPLLGLDIGICAWSGTGDDLERHGWRSAAALVAVTLAQPANRMPGLLGRRLPLGAGRSRPERWEPQRDRSLRKADSSLMVTLKIQGESAVITDEMSLRRPLGNWPVAAVYAARKVVRILEETASKFVFQPGNLVTVGDLQFAIRLALEGMVRDGILGGENRPMPDIQASLEGDRTQPVLVALVRAVLRPWLVALVVDINIARNTGATLTLR